MTGMLGVLWPQLRELVHPSASGDVAVGASRLGRMIPKFDIVILSREGGKANLCKCANVLRRLGLLAEIRFVFC